MNLLIDQGNTRVKACLYDVDLRKLEAVSSIAALQAYLLAHNLPIDAIAIASVASVNELTQLITCLKRALPSARIYNVHYDAQVLPSAYLEPSRLGVDRWLAMLAVKECRDAIVVDAGTAFTVDVLRAGQHLGGYILPGLALQRDALASQTAAVNFPKADVADLTIGRHTAACVGHGSLRALSALVSSVVDEFGGELTVPTYLTGGDAATFMPHLKAEHRPLLVFEGLQLALSGYLTRGDQ